MRKVKTRKTYDWEAIEREFSLGQKSLRMLTAEFGPTPGAISKRANKEGWTQDKSAEVKQKTKAALLKETQEGNSEGNTPSREDINRAVQTNIQIIREHRKDIAKGRSLVELLAGQLREAAQCRPELEEQVLKEDSSAQTKAKMLKAVSLPSHAGVLRDLTMALKNLVPLERQAFNLDDSGDDKPKRPFSELSDDELMAIALGKNHE